MITYYDISVPLTPGITPFPGDPTYELSWPHMSHSKGDAVNVGFFSGNLHLGTHVDAPYHFLAEGSRLHQLPLHRWIGPCLVVDCTSAVDCVTDAIFDALTSSIPERVILKTRNTGTEYWHSPWNAHFIYLEQSAATWLMRKGVRTVGFDYMSIDPVEKADCPSHRVILGHDGCIIETLDLRTVSPGLYELFAAPIPLLNADGGWCRALLRKEE